MGTCTNHCKRDTGEFWSLSVYVTTNVGPRDFYTGCTQISLVIMSLCQRDYCHTFSILDMSNSSTLPPQNAGLRIRWQYLSRCQTPLSHSALVCVINALRILLHESHHFGQIVGVITFKTTDWTRQDLLCEQHTKHLALVRSAQLNVTHCLLKVVKLAKISRQAVRPYFLMQLLIAISKSNTVLGVNFWYFLWLLCTAPNRDNVPHPRALHTSTSAIDYISSSLQHETGQVLWMATSAHGVSHTNEIKYSTAFWKVRGRLYHVVRTQVP